MTTETNTVNLLSEGQLGSSRDLLLDRDSWYENLSDHLGRETPAVSLNHAQDALARIVTRSSLDDAFSSLDWHDDDDDANEVVPFESEVRSGLWVSNLAGSDPIRRSFRARARRIFPEAEFGPLKLANIEHREVHSVDRAIALLESKFGDVWQECARTVHVIAIHDSTVVSMQTSYTPETVYLGTSILCEPTWVIADAILHETLHERTLLQRQLWRLLGVDYVEDEAPTIHLPWSGGNVPDRYFSPWRLISAAHVYTHLNVFRRTLGLHREAELPFTRARFMLNALADDRFRMQLGTEGLALCDHLRRSLHEGNA